MTKVAMVREKDYSKDLVVTSQLAIKLQVHDIAHDNGIRLPTWDEVTESKKVLQKLEGKPIWVTSFVGSEPFILDIRGGGNFGAGTDARLWPYTEAHVVGFRLGTKDLKRG